MDDNLALIEDQGKALLYQAQRDLHRPVPQYEGWNLGDLLQHTSGVHRRTARVVSEGLSQRIEVESMPDGINPAEWYLDGLVLLLDAFSASDPHTEVWGFAPGWDVASWARRMSVETGVHRWDADDSWGEERALDPEVARNGLDEFEVMWLPRLGRLPMITVTARDLGLDWTWGHPDLDGGVVEDTASSLYLGLMARPGSMFPDPWDAEIHGLSKPRR